MVIIVNIERYNRKWLSFPRQKFVFAGQKFWKWETKVEETSATKFASLLRQCRSRRYYRSQWNHPPPQSFPLPPTHAPSDNTHATDACRVRTFASNQILRTKLRESIVRLYRVIQKEWKREKEVKKKKCFTSSSRSRKREFRRLVSLERRKII